MGWCLLEACVVTVYEFIFLFSSQMRITTFLKHILNDKQKEKAHRCARYNQQKKKEVSTTIEKIKEQFKVSLETFNNKNLFPHQHS